MKLWLDDRRRAPVGFIWARTAAEAIEILKQGEVTYCSLDHDLVVEHYDELSSQVPTGYAVVLWMEEHGVWPADGTRVHSLNAKGRAKMLHAIEKAYGRTFQTALDVPDDHWVGL